MKPAPEVADLAAGLRARDRLALSRAISLVERAGPARWELLHEIWRPERRARVIGVTGPPGAGKSTLLGRLIRRWRDRGESVGVIAIDPSSPFSGGAILGDRIRMQEHALDDDVFIRSLSTRGRQGGLTASTRDVIRVLDAFGFDMILVETVGVGQTELEIMHVADTTVVILVPEAGDTVQVMKAGLLEVADVFAVNKSDREGAERMSGELSAMLERVPRRTGWRVPVLETAAIEDRGVADLQEKIDEHGSFAGKRAENPEDETIRTVIEEANRRLDHALRRGTLAAYPRAAGAGEADPYALAEKLFADEEGLRRALRLKE